MALSGNSRELSLADLILVKAQDPGSYRITLSGPSGDGLLLIHKGEVVHAAYGGLRPEDAVYRLVTEEDVDFVITADADITAHTLQLGAQQMLMEAMRRFDEGLVKAPREVNIDLPDASQKRQPPRAKKYSQEGNPEAEALRRAMGRVLFAEDVIVEESRSRRTLLNVLGVALLLGLAIVGWYYFQRSDFTTPAEFGEALDATNLDGARDRLPVLVAGVPPPNPQPDAPVVPTIVCRVLVDPEGRVLDARLYESPRLGLAAFESAALEAVREFEFTPALKDGKRVPVWVLWTVDFAPPAVVANQRPTMRSSSLSTLAVRRLPPIAWGRVGSTVRRAAPSLRARQTTLAPQRGRARTTPRASAANSSVGARRV